VGGPRNTAHSARSSRKRVNEDLFSGINDNIISVERRAEHESGRCDCIAYFAKTDDSGNYKLESAPDGEYNLVAWHEGMKQQTKPQSVAGTTKVDFPSRSESHTEFASQS